MVQFHSCIVAAGTIPLFIKNHTRTRVPFYSIVGSRRRRLLAIRCLVFVRYMSSLKADKWWICAVQTAEETSPWAAMMSMFLITTYWNTIQYVYVDAVFAFFCGAPGRFLRIFDPCSGDLRPVFSF